jgi:hypothetical protein
LLTAAYAHTLQGQIRSVRQIAPGVFTRFGDRDARQPANTSWIEFRDFVVVIEQVAGGKKTGKSLEQLLKDVNLSRHGDFAADQQQNQSAIRAVFRKAPEPQ